MARQATKPARETRASSEIAPSSAMRKVSHADIAALAYDLWMQRGCPEGTADRDWQDAEKQLQSLKKG